MAILIKKGKANNITEFHATEKPGFELKKNATKAWKAAGLPLEGEALKKFCEDYLTKNLSKTDLSGGFYIVLDSPIQNKLKRPYKVTRNVNEGTRKFTTSYLLTGKVTGKKYSTLVGTGQAAAIKAAIGLCKEHKEDIDIDVIKVCTDGISVVTTVEYAPSEDSKQGEFLMFGRIEGVIISK